MSVKLRYQFYQMLFPHVKLPWWQDELNVQKYCLKLNNLNKIIELEFTEVVTSATPASWMTTFIVPSVIFKELSIFSSWFCHSSSLVNLYSVETHFLLRIFLESQLFVDLLGNRNVLPFIDLPSPIWFSQGSNYDSGMVVKNHNHP